MKNVALTIALCIASLSAIADEKGLRTEDRDGKWWATIDGDVRAVYIVGLRDGGLLGYYYAIPRMSDKDKACRDAIMTNFEDRRQPLDNLTTAELVKRLDSFYADKANAKVIVPAALFYISRRTAGDSVESLAPMLRGFRQ